MATLLILARILAPADFGLTALAISIVWVADMVMEVPLAQVLVRLPRIERAHYDTAFTLGVLRAAVLTLLLVAIASPFARFFGDDRLFALVVVLSLAPAVRGLQSPKIADHMRQLRFAPLFASLVGAKIIAAALALMLLWGNGGYWSIAAYNVASGLCATAITFIVAPYRPAFTLSQFKVFSDFLGWFSLSQLVAALNWQSDRMILGAGINNTVLGQYTMATDLASLPNQALVTPAMQPLMSAFSRLNEDPQRLRLAFLKAASVTMMVTAPLCILLWWASDWITGVLFNEQWEHIAQYLSLLALAVLPLAYSQVFHNLALAMGNTNAIFRLNTIELATRLVLVPAGLILGSVIGVIIARGVISLLMLLICLHFAKKLIGTTIVSQLGSLVQVGLASLAMIAGLAGSASLLERFALGPTLETVVVASGGMIVYVITLYALGAGRLVGLPRIRRSAR